LHKNTQNTEGIIFLHRGRGKAVATETTAGVAETTEESNHAQA
jgi:hypothetical protein